MISPTQTGLLRAGPAPPELATAVAKCVNKESISNGGSCRKEERVVAGLICDSFERCGGLTMKNLCGGLCRVYAVPLSVPVIGLALD
jgi:hypothetical protein